VNIKFSHLLTHSLS